MTRAASVLLVAGAIAATGCGRGSDAADGDGGNGGDAAPEGTVLVAAAASLTDVMDDLAAAFEAEVPDVDVRVSVGGSSSLAVSIEEGAPVDVFASANEAVMDRIVASGAVDGTPVFVATNEIVLAVPAGTGPDGSGVVSSLEDVARGELFVGACAPQVPCGASTDELLASAGVVAAFDSRDGDVRAVVTKLVEGELDAGFVYRTDVDAFDDQLDVVPFPDGVSARTRYPVAVVTDAPNPTAARAFVAFLTGDVAQASFVTAGFGAP